MFQRERNAIRDMLGSLHMTVLRNAERTIGPLLLSNSLLKVLRGGIAKLNRKVFYRCVFLRTMSPLKSVQAGATVRRRGVRPTGKTKAEHLFGEIQRQPTRDVKSPFSTVAMSRLWCSFHAMRHSFFVSDQWVAF